MQIDVFRYHLQVSLLLVITRRESYHVRFVRATKILLSRAFYQQCLKRVYRDDDGKSLICSALAPMGVIVQRKVPFGRRKLSRPRRKQPRRTLASNTDEKLIAAITAAAVASG